MLHTQFPQAGDTHEQARKKATLIRVTGSDLNLQRLDKQLLKATDLVPILESRPIWTQQYSTDDRQMEARNQSGQLNSQSQNCSASIAERPKHGTSGVQTTLQIHCCEWKMVACTHLAMCKWEMNATILNRLCPTIGKNGQ